jgi:rhamnogalacturonan endolyase
MSFQINSYTGSTPSAPTNLNSRGVTRGAYRGFGEVYDVSIPSGTIVAGTNTVSQFDRRLLLLVC